MDPQQEQELYDEIRSAFTAVESSTPEEFVELAGSIFTSDDYWANGEEGDRYYIEPRFDDPAKPLIRLFEQRPAISTITFSFEGPETDSGIVEYARRAFARSNGYMLAINYSMIWFFLGYGLLPRCLRGHNSKEKILNVAEGWERGRRSSGEDGASGLFRVRGEEFGFSPVVFCGALRPSELLERAQGYKSVVVFPYDGIDLDEDRNWVMTAYLLEFPQPIEPVYTADELCEKLRASTANADSWAPTNRLSGFYFV